MTMGMGILAFAVILGGLVAILFVLGSIGIRLDSIYRQLEQQSDYMIRHHHEK
ncbi:unnamed protein product [marine sediment metagenome]|uniref:Uncharacterized protein n=1 Tax=marine sediment metagenome TaxID=412755 RepID=X0Y3X1_9ZZZZ